MSGRFHARIVLACVAGSIACAGDRAVEPVVFATLALRGAATAELDPGDQVQLVPVALDQGGMPIDRPLVKLFSSSAPEIASVSIDGRVTGMTLGTATISVAATLGGTIRTTDITITVRRSADLVLRPGNFGWEPLDASVAIGGLVRWKSSGSKIWLMDPDDQVFDTLDLSGGSATRRFDKAGTITFCVDDCWDSYWGVFHVR